MQLSNYLNSNLDVEEIFECICIRFGDFRLTFGKFDNGVAFVHSCSLDLDKRRL